jgi:hypothetical protein
LSSSSSVSTSQFERERFGCGESVGVRGRFSPRELSVSAAEVAELDIGGEGEYE